MAAEPDDARHGDERPMTEPAAAAPSAAEPPGSEPAAAKPPVPGRPADELLALLEGDGELTGDQAAALARLDEGQLDPADDDPWPGHDDLLACDPAAGLPPEWPELSAGEQQVWMDAEEASAVEPASPVAAVEPVSPIAGPEPAKRAAAEVLDAGFTHPPGRAGPRFRRGRDAGPDGAGRDAGHAGRPRLGGRPRPAVRR
jgi:hypothetical protein